jgi:hypothetical protein
MSQVTLVSDDDLKALGVEKAIPENVRESPPQDCESDGEDRYDPPVIHILSINDTMKSICQRYEVPVIFRILMIGRTSYSCK